MTKIELFNLLNSGIDKSGNLKKIGGFKKHYADFFNEFLNTKFNEEIDKLPFKQKIWHFLNDVYEIPKCKICGKKVNFLTRSGQWGYCNYCSGSCAMKDKDVKNKLNETKIKKYGNYKYNNSNKLKETLSNKDDDFWKERIKKSIETRINKNNGKYFSESTIQKIKNTNKERYGVDSYTKTNQFKELIAEKHDDIQRKQYTTKSKNKSFNTSKNEDNFSSFLDEIKLVYIRQYKSDLYPFSCDFYIPSIDLYIEIQGNWTHGGHPFDKDNIDDIKKLNLWKEKNSPYYNNAIYAWTDLDVRKRKIALDNKLNYLEIFSDNIDECISIFYDYLKTLE
jgi:hypothetical protein